MYIFEYLEIYSRRIPYPVYMWARLGMCNLIVAEIYSSLIFILILCASIKLDVCMPNYCWRRCPIIVGFVIVEMTHNNFGSHCKNILLCVAVWGTTASSVHVFEIKHVLRLKGDSKPRERFFSLLRYERTIFGIEKTLINKWIRILGNGISLPLTSFVHGIFFIIIMESSCFLLILFPGCS